MRKLLVVALVAACAHKKELQRHVFVPKNYPGAAACWRECRAIEATCNSKTTVYVGRGMVAVGGASESACGEQRKDCLVSCPGAQVEWLTEEEIEARWGGE